MTNLPRPALRIQGPNCGLSRNATHTNMRTLADLIAFNNAHCEEELVYFGQEIFEQSEQTVGYLNDPTY